MLKINLRYIQNPLYGTLQESSGYETFITLLAMERPSGIELTLKRKLLCAMKCKLMKT